MTLTKKSKLIVFILLTLLTLVLVIFALFDVKFVYQKRTLPTEGIILENKSDANKFLSALESLTIPYKLETEDGRFNFTWDKKYSLQVESIKQNVLNILPKNKRGTCFIDQDSRDELASKLDRASIMFEVNDKDNELKCVYWALEDDKRVLIIEPRIQEIRKLEATRKNIE